MALCKTKSRPIAARELSSLASRQALRGPNRQTHRKCSGTMANALALLLPAAVRPHGLHKVARSEELLTGISAPMCS